MSVLVSACNGTSSGPGSGSSAASDQTGGVLTRLWSDLRQDEADIVVPPIRLPLDLSPHPEAAAESFQLQAILSREDGAMISVQAQLDRLALAVAANPSSAWGFSDIMRSSVLIGSPGQAELAARETIERRALSLADSDRNRIHVNDTYLDYQTQAGRQSALTSPGECRVRYEFSTVLSDPESSEPESLSLEIAMQACPEALSLRGLNRWQASALATTATIPRSNPIAVTGDNTLWQGYTWLSQTWGNLPPAGGAVLIDRLNLRLTTETGADALVISASRSKRRTGRGPQTVQGALSSQAGGAQALDLQWRDEGEQVSSLSGLVYPQRFRVRSNDESIDLLLTPVVSLPEVRDSLGIRWAGAVTVSGSHSGVGFLDFQPLDGAGANVTE